MTGVPRDTLQLELGAVGRLRYVAPAIPEGGPMLRASWVRSSRRLLAFRAWRGASIEAGALQSASSGSTRWATGLDLAAGVSLERSSWRIDAGWRVGARLVLASPGASSPDDLDLAGWLFATSGPRLGLRIGPPDRWGLLLHADLDGYYLDVDNDPLTAPSLHTRMSIWAGVELPTR